MKLYRIVLFALIPVVLSGQISGPITVRHIDDRNLAIEQQASDFAEQWIAAFSVFKVTPGINIEIVTSKDDNVLTLDNIWGLKKVPQVTSQAGARPSNLLIAVQRIGKRDYFVILDPRQIRYIRQVKAE